MMAYTGTSAAHSTFSSSYRVKFRRNEFLELVEIAQPKIIYHVSRMHFFSYDGFVMYSFDCSSEDFLNVTVIHGIEFTNYQWKET